MSDPSSFVGWDEYMGLNQGVGDSMSEGLDAQGNKLRSAAVDAGNAHYGAARNGGAAEFARTGEQARKGLASYGEFMQGMRDPAARMALMEKTYGKGSVSALDSAMVGNRGPNDFSKVQNQMESQSMRADERQGAYAKMNATSDAAMAQDKANRQAASDKNQAMLKKRAQDDDDRAVDAYGHWYMGDNYNPNQAYGGTNYSGEGSLNQATGGGSPGNTSREYMRTLKKQHEARTGRAFHSSTGKRRGSWDIGGDQGDDYAATPPANSWAKKHNGP
jgi:hypothetical protein